jgi:hypothetical protein
VKMKNTYKILIRKPEKKNPFSRSSIICGDIFKTDPKNRLLKGVESTNVAQTTVGLRRREN